MLKQRILTAVLMLLVLLPALFHSNNTYIAVLSLILIGASAWEWGRLMGCSQISSISWSVLTVVICSTLLFFDIPKLFTNLIWMIVGLTWVLSSVYLIAGGPARWERIPRMIRIMSGPLILTMAWIALYLSKSMGTGFLLSVLLIVWVADISAYFAGRQWGKHKIAPDISPGKSWEGLVGGVIGVFALAGIWLYADIQLPMLQGGIFEKLKMHGWPLFFIGILFLTLMSVAGDLFESLIKRSAGAKDSSRLLPGHGGVLDRLDALLPVLPLAVMLAQIPLP